VRALANSLEPGQPLILVGYSNGAALAVDYTLTALASDGALRRPDLLLLLSPAVQVAPVAAYARIQRWVSYLPGMEKLGWTDVVSEFDPFKYNSFPVYAGEQIYGLTKALERGFSRLSADLLEQFPPVLAFQSILDATIPPTSFIDALLTRLAGTPAELVVFDINRNEALLPLLADHGDTLLNRLAATPTLSFDLTMVGNEDAYSQQVTVKTRRTDSTDWERQDAPAMRWPRNVYSLSHVALPFDANDPVYGTNETGGPTRLGDLWLRGERGGLGVPLNLLARQRFNPFFGYLESRVLTAAGELVTAE
jgi:pimeloyl-ACP methyl ester carboxylesterase